MMSKKLHFIKWRFERCAWQMITGITYSVQMTYLLQLTISRIFSANCDECELYSTDVWTSNAAYGYDVEKRRNFRMKDNVLS